MSSPTHTPDAPGAPGSSAPDNAQVDHVGIALDAHANAFVILCTRCSARDHKTIPISAAQLRTNPALLPQGFDLDLGQWIAAFRDRHGACPAAATAAHAPQEAPP